MITVTVLHQLHMDVDVDVDGKGGVVDGYGVLEGEDASIDEKAGGAQGVPPRELRRGPCETLSLPLGVPSSSQPIFYHIYLLDFSSTLKMPFFA